jgi:hypothetical protein
LAVANIVKSYGWIQYACDKTDFDRVDSWSQSSKNAALASWVPEWVQHRIGPDFFHSVTGVAIVYYETPEVGEDVMLSRDELRSDLAALPDVRELHFYNSNVDDEALSIVSKLRGLNVLICDKCARAVTTRGIAHLARAPRVRRIEIYNANLTDECLSILATIDSLEELNVGMNPITDAGVAHLARLTRLRKLCIDNLDEGLITDAGLAHLESLQSLEELSVNFADVTEDGIARLKRAIPTLKRVQHRKSLLKGPAGSR